MDLSPLLTNPVVMGALITTGLNSVKPMLKKVDEGKLLEPYQKHLHIVMLVLTFLVSALQSGLSGHLADLDLNQVANFLNVYLPALVGAKAMTLANPSKK